MALFAIGDLHLSLSVNKPMDVFGGWENYVQRLEENWNHSISADDTVVLAGDSSWGMTLSEALADFRFIDALPGKKLLLKGNHDYWWTSNKKMTDFFAANGLDSLFILHNNAYAAEGFRVCGSRGWIFENGEPQDEKVIKREAIRIEASLKAAEALSGECLLFLHYPPVYAGQELTEYIALMQRYGIRRCFYGHIHGAGRRAAVQGLYKDVDFTVISADALQFAPLKIELKPENRHF